MGIQDEQLTDVVLLTRRQLEILQLITEDLTGKEIADRLGITPKTVEFHRALLKKQLGKVGTAGMARIAIGNGWIRP